MTISIQLLPRWRWVCVTAVFVLLAGAPGAGAAASNCAALNNTAIFRSGQPPFIYDEYASAVALSEDTAVVGARAEIIGPGGARGASYVYVRSNGMWGLQQKLAAPQFLGEVLAIEGDTIVAGMSESERALVYVRQEGVWTLQQVLMPSGALGQLYFGYSVAIHDGRIVVGAPAENNATGAAYVFERRQGNWEQMAKLTASDASSWDAFGWSVSISGNTALVGSGRHQFPDYAGAAYVFVLTNGTWNEQAILTAVPENRLFDSGITVAISGDTAAMNYVGFPKSVYVFRRNGVNWSLERTFKGRTQALEPGFGRGMALLGDRLVVGSPASRLLGTNAVGVVHVYDRSATQWVEKELLVPAPGTAPTLGSFGLVVALNQSGTLVGAHGSFSGPDRSGAAYVFESDSTPPVVHAISATPSTLWPPNHRMVPVTIQVNASDNCGETRCWITSVSSSEDSGKKPKVDWQITGDLTVNLRAAREGKGPGRIYTVIVACQDDVGNTTEAAITVTVPHDNRPPKQ